LRKRDRPWRGGLDGTREDGWIIYRARVGSKGCPLGLGMDEHWASIDDKMTKRETSPHH